MKSQAERLAVIREREADPQVYVHGNKVANAIKAGVDPAEHNALIAKVHRATSPKAKVILLRELADGLNAAAAPHVACSKGCSHCCHMPVLVGATEAAQIAKDIGVPMAKPEFSFPPERDLAFDGVPCTFLVDGACSIYNSRPYACRTHLIVDRDETLCEIFPGVEIISPMLRVDTYDKAYVHAFGEAEWSQMADLRRFFPKGRGKR